MLTSEWLRWYTLCFRNSNYVTFSTFACAQIEVLLYHEHYFFLSGKGFLEAIVDAEVGGA